MTLQFLVNNQNLSISPTQKNISVIADSKNYLKARFVFQTSDWKKGNIYYALFSHNGKTYKKFLGIEEGVESNECYVAPEVIKAGGFTVSVFCEDLITTNTVTIPVQASGYTENIENQKATKSVQEQINTLMHKYAVLCNDILKECQKIKENLEDGK